MDILPFIVSGTNVSKSLREICFKEKHKLNAGKIEETIGIVSSG